MRSTENDVTSTDVRLAGVEWKVVVGPEMEDLPTHSTWTVVRPRLVVYRGGVPDFESSSPRWTWCRELKEEVRSKYFLGNWTLQIVRQLSWLWSYKCSGGQRTKNQRVDKSRTSLDWGGQNQGVKEGRVGVRVCFGLIYSKDACLSLFFSDSSFL